MQKMTRDGLVEQNLASGEEIRISQRGQDFQLKQSSTENASQPAGKHSGSRPSQHSDHYQTERFRQEYSSPTDSVDSHSIHAYENSLTASQPILAPQSEYTATKPYEPRSYTAPSESKSPVKKGAKQRQNLTVQQDNPETYKDTPRAETTECNSEKPPNQALNATENPSTCLQSPETTKSRLQFGETAQTVPDLKSKRQHGTKYQRTFVQDAVPAATDNAPPQKAERLQFTADEKPPDDKISKLESKSARSKEKLTKAKDSLPTKNRFKAERVFDEAKGKSKTKFSIEKEVIPQGGKKAVLPVRAGKNLAHGASCTAENKIHQKISEVEHENVGVKAAHKVEQSAEQIYRGPVRKALRFVKSRPYRRVARLEKKVIKADIKLDYHRTLHENPKLKSNIFSRMLQKQKIKRQYAKAARETSKKTSKATKKITEKAIDALKAVFYAIKSHPGVVLTIGALALLIVIVMSMVSSCTNMAAGGIGAVFSSSYLSKDTDIDNAELLYTEWEADLQMQVNNAESSHSGFDEYRYNVDDIGHDPYELMAFLTAKYQDFTVSEIRAVLAQIFAQQYQLSFVEETEIRYADPNDADGDGDYEPYEWRILNINLTSKSFTELILPDLNSSEKEIFDLLMQSKGNRQYAYSPFDFNWLPYVSCYYGWRIHPITGAKDYHKAIDIAVAQETSIIAAHDGTVTAVAYDSSYGNYLALDDGKGLVTKYAHCSKLLVSVGQSVKKGDVIAKVGSTGSSTGPHLHFEVIYNGQYFNPLFFSVTGDDGTGKNRPGSPGGVEYPSYPGEPITDDAYAAMIAEAEKHLGKKYVFGASGPKNFDCSGFICWVLDKSGVKPMGRTNAQGLYNMSTPVSPENAKPGDLIFFTGTYSTPNACSHVGIYVGNGKMIHCGNPIQYTSIETKYWKEHFYAFGRIN